jgi:hypothetical protein
MGVVVGLGWLGGLNKTDMQGQTERAPHIRNALEPYKYTKLQKNTDYRK